MRLTEQKVTAPQFFSLLFLSVLSTIFMYISSPRISIAQTDALLRPVIFVFMSVVFAIPSYCVFKYLRHSAEKGLHIKNTVFFKIIAVFYGAVYFVGALKSVLRFDLFASSELFPGTDMTLFLVAVVAVCGVVSLLGLGALCRGSVIFCLVVIGATVFVMLSLVDEFDVLNFTPLFTEGYKKFFEDSFLFCVQATEIGTIALFLPQIKGDVKKHYILWVTLSAAAFIGVLAFVIGALGTFADTQLFPTYTAVTLASFGLLERIDALETAIWILCVIAKISFYILIITKMVLVIAPKLSRKSVCISVCAVLCAVPVFISGNIQRFGFISNDIISIVLYSAATVILPTFTALYLKRWRPYEKNQESV